MCIRDSYSKGERRNSNQTLPRIACQVFEKQLAALSVEDKENFPVCKYNPDSDVIRGIYTSVDDFKKHRNTIEYLTYGYDNGRQFVIYCWNICSTIIFVQECLKPVSYTHLDVYKRQQYIIGTAYRDGGLLIPDMVKAQKLLERAAEQGLDAAQYALGKLYLLSLIHI